MALEHQNKTSDFDLEYQTVISNMYSRLGAFHRQGAQAYKPGLDNVLKLSELFGNPHKKLKTIHIAGTNGKGSTSSLIAAVLTAAGYKTGLYTSPHLVDFTERVRINGNEMPKSEVISFYRRIEALELDIEPSFFELTTVMAFDWFVRQGVDIAVIETGLGGRLDATNIITPEVSVITNISLDHTDLLGNTLSEIAREKAGIIKPGVPVVIGEHKDETDAVFEQEAMKKKTTLIWAQDNGYATGTFDSEMPQMSGYGCLSHYPNTPWGEVVTPLTGPWQRFNCLAAMCAIQQLSARGIKLSPKDVKEGFRKVISLSGLRGRWERCRFFDCDCIVDTGHNTAAWHYIVPQLEKHIARGDHVVLVLGFCRDKDYKEITLRLPHKCTIISTHASTPRAVPANELSSELYASGHKDVITAPTIHVALCTLAKKIKSMKHNTNASPLIFIGGSNYVVGEFLNCLHDSDELLS